MPSLTRWRIAAYENQTAAQQEAQRPRSKPDSVRHHLAAARVSVQVAGRGCNQFNERLCRVIRVNECSAVVIMNQRVRDFKTRFDKPVRFEQPPKLFRIRPNSEVPILNRRKR